MSDWPTYIAIILIGAWVFALSEDLWLNKVLGYQIRAEAEKLKTSPIPALSFFDQNTRKGDFVAVALGLSLIVISFPFGPNAFVMWLFIAIGATIIVHYIWRKLNLYNEAVRKIPLS
ncbi:MAG: hypothetical protein AAGH53_02320 [Pseudomonadota bacterium]